MLPLSMVESIKYLKVSITNHKGKSLSRRTATGYNSAATTSRSLEGTKLAGYSCVKMHHDIRKSMQMQSQRLVLWCSATQSL
jgi:hypothetical protein